MEIKKIRIENIVGKEEQKKNQKSIMHLFVYIRPVCGELLYCTSIGPYQAQLNSILITEPTSFCIFLQQPAHCIGRKQLQLNVYFSYFTLWKRQFN